LALIFLPLDFRCRIQLLAALFGAAGDMQLVWLFQSWRRSSSSRESQRPALDRGHRIEGRKSRPTEKWSMPIIFAWVKRRPDRVHCPPVGYRVRGDCVPDAIERLLTRSGRSRRAETLPHFWPATTMRIANDSRPMIGRSCGSDLPAASVPHGVEG